MAEPGLKRRTSHRKVLSAIVVVVLLAHALVTQGVMHELAARHDEAQSGIERMEAEFKVDMQLTEPPSVVALAPETAAESMTEVVPDPPEPVAEKASAPEEKASEPPPEPTAEPAPPVASASAAATGASAPEAVSPALAELASANTASPAASQASADQDGEVFQWPKATRVTYKVQGFLRGEIHGSAQVAWIRQGHRYQVHIDAIVGPSFAPIGSQRWTSEGVITPDGLVPERFESINKLLIKTSPPKVVKFGRRNVTLPTGEELPKLPGVQDPASHYIQLAYGLILDNSALTPGNLVGIPMAWTKKQDMIVYDVVSEETLTTPLGQVDTYKLVPRTLTEQKGDVLAEIWIAPALQYLPIRMLFRQGPDTYLELNMDKPPQQVAADDPVSEQTTTLPPLEE